MMKAGVHSFQLRVLPRIPGYLLLAVGAVIFTIPFAWTVTTALKPASQLYKIPIQWIPNPIKWSNFMEAWQVLPTSAFLKNTLIITVLAVVGQVISASLAAYGFARFRFRGRDGLFMILLGTMMLPAQVTMIPSFLIWRELHLVNTIAPLTIPAFFGGGAFAIFLLRQFLMTIPRTLDEAAMIDGCSYFGIWWRIILPLSKPALTTIVILAFLSNWDDFMGPLIYLHSIEKYTLSVGLRMFSDMYMGRLELLMTASLIHIAPCIILFASAQRYFIKGIVMSGIKG